MPHLNEVGPRPKHHKQTLDKGDALYVEFVGCIKNTRKN